MGKFILSSPLELEYSNEVIYLCWPEISFCWDGFTTNDFNSRHSEMLLEYPNFNRLTLHVVFNWALSFLKKNISNERITFGQNENISHDNPRFCRFIRAL